MGARCWAGIGCQAAKYICGLLYFSCHALGAGLWALMVGNWVLKVLYQVCLMLRPVCYMFSVECWGLAGWTLWNGYYRLGFVCMGWDVGLSCVLYGLVVT